MSSARAGSMGKIQAFIDGHAVMVDPEMLDEDVQLDQAADVQSNKDVLEAQRLERATQLAEQSKIKTEAEVLKYEQAKRKVTSSAAKNALDEEIDTIRAEKLRADQERAQLTAREKAVQGITGYAGKQYERIDQGVNRVVDTGKGIWDDLSRIATPGSIFLPVSILLVFWLLLLPVNGHTRIEWLWLALTGNAHLSDIPTGGNTTSSSGFTTGTSGNPAGITNAQALAQLTSPFQDPTTITGLGYDVNLLQQIANNAPGYLAQQYGPGAVQQIAKNEVQSAQTLWAQIKHFFS